MGRDTFNMIVECRLSGISSSVIDVPVSIQGAAAASEARFFFLDFPGGTRKRFFFRSIFALLRARQKKCISLSTSTIADVLLKDRKTAKYTFTRPIICP